MPDLPRTEKNFSEKVSRKYAHTELENEPKTAKRGSESSETGQKFDSEASRKNFWREIQQEELEGIFDFLDQDDPRNHDKRHYSVGRPALTHQLLGARGGKARDRERDRHFFREVQRWKKAYN